MERIAAHLFVENPTLKGWQDEKRNLDDVFGDGYWFGFAGKGVTDLTDQWQLYRDSL